MSNTGQAYNDENYQCDYELYKGTLEEIFNLVSKGIDATDELNGSTALCWAVSHPADIAIAKALIDAGADVNHQNDDGRTALFTAACDNLDGVKLLLAAGADPEIRVLRWAAAKGPLEIVKILFDAIEKKKAEKNIASTDEFNKKTVKAVFDPINHFEEFNKIRQKIIKTIKSPRKKKPGWML